jgi:hypothetical protein
VLIGIKQLRFSIYRCRSYLTLWQSPCLEVTSLLCKQHSVCIYFGHSRRANQWPLHTGWDDITVGDFRRLPNFYLQK